MTATHLHWTDTIDVADEGARASLARVALIARLMDNAITVPGIGVRVGFDSILGLVPGIGDAATAAISGLLILEARRLGLPREALMRMAANVAIDAGIGAVPLLGDVADVFFKANLRNLRIIREHLERADGRVIDGSATRLD